MSFLKSILPKIEVNYSKIVVILEKSKFVQNCPILATGKDFCTIVWLAVIQTLIVYLKFL